MNPQGVSTNGHSVILTGDQVRFIRNLLNESRAKFALRFAVDQNRILRLEGKGSEEQSGPLIILIDMLAKQYRIDVPDKVMRRPAEANAS